MSKKKAILLNGIWQALYDACLLASRNVTAGELGKYTGISRNTAKKYLEELIINHAARRIHVLGKNKQPVAYYEPITDDEA